jgi:hypothetical protein
MSKLPAAKRCFLLAIASPALVLLFFVLPSMFEVDREFGVLTYSPAFRSLRIGILVAIVLFPFASLIAGLKAFLRGEPTEERDAGWMASGLVIASFCALVISVSAGIMVAGRLTKPSIPVVMPAWRP